MAGDEELMLEFAGDRRFGALEELVRRYGDRLYNFALRYLEHPQDAEEALQDTFVQVIRFAETFKRSESVKAWLYCIAAQRCVDIKRRQAI